MKAEQFINSSNIEEVTGNNLLNHALHYAKMGYSVFPVHNMIADNDILSCSCAKVYCANPGKHPQTRYGHKEATTDSKKINLWWTSHPDANIGLLTGVDTKLLVLDVDPKDGGYYALEGLEEKYDALPETLTVLTGSGGRHFYFKYPSNLTTIKGSVKAIGAGLDIRANGNYVLAPPSNHKSGQSYSWAEFDTPISEIPVWLLGLILQNRQTDKSNPSNANKKAAAKISRPKIIKDGEGRHQFLFNYICGIVNNRMKEEVLELALRKNKECLEPPKEEEYVIYQVDYLYGRYGKK